MRTRIVGPALAVALALSGAVPVHAAARVFVSVFGSDGGDCANRNTPCRTLGAGITQVDAGGEVIVIDTGSYGGATITKSVKVNVPTGVVAFTASAFTVNAGVTDVVVLRGLTLKALTPGVGNAINFISGAALHVENCVIDGWAEGITVNPASISSKAFLIDTVVRNSSGGASVSAGIVSVDNVRMENNTPGCAVFVFDGTVSVMRSVATGNSSGFCAGGATAVLNVEGSMASSNENSGFVSGSGAVVRVAKCIVTGNDVGLFNSGSTLESLGNSLVRGNATNTSGAITIVAGQ
jgi:hypothetical protein